MPLPVRPVVDPRRSSEFAATVPCQQGRRSARTAGGGAGTPSIDGSMRTLPSPGGERRMRAAPPISSSRARGGAWPSGTGRRRSADAPALVHARMQCGSGRPVLRRRRCGGGGAWTDLGLAVRRAGAAHGHAPSSGAVAASGARKGPRVAAGEAVPPVSGSADDPFLAGGVEASDSPGRAAGRGAVGRSSRRCTVARRDRGVTRRAIGDVARGLLGPCRWPALRQAPGRPVPGDARPRVRLPPRRRPG